MKSIFQFHIVQLILAVSTVAALFWFGYQASTDTDGQFKGFEGSYLCPSPAAKFSRIVIKNDLQIEGYVVAERALPLGKLKIMSPRVARLKFELTRQAIQQMGFNPKARHFLIGTGTTIEFRSERTRTEPYSYFLCTRE